MKKVFLMLAAGLMFSAAAMAVVQPPLDSRGTALASLDWVGALPCGIDNSTGTNAILCGAAGRSVVYGVIVTSITGSDFITFRDTNTANLTSSTATIVYNTYAGQNINGAALNPSTNFIKFTVPLQFTNGISVNDLAAPTANGISRWTILYRPLRANE